MSAVQAFSAPMRNLPYRILLLLAMVLSLASPGAMALGSGHGSLFGNSEFLPVDESLTFDYQSIIPI